jgi:protein-L-isoaspartate(D-aspartate) O-methyltransferase
VIPVGSRHSQELLVVTRAADGTTSQRSLGGCQFVPLLGREGFADQ